MARLRPPLTASFDPPLLLRAPPLLGAPLPPSEPGAFDECLVEPHANDPPTEMMTRQRQTFARTEPQNVCDEARIRCRA